MTPTRVVTLRRRDPEVAPAILRPAALPGLAAERPLPAVRHREDAVCRNAQRLQVPADRRCAAFAEGQIVLRGPALVAMARHGERHVRVGCRRLDVTRGGRPPSATRTTAAPHDRNTAYTLRSNKWSSKRYMSYCSVRGRAGIAAAGVTRYGDTRKARAVGGAVTGLGRGGPIAASRGPSAPGAHAARWRHRGPGGRCVHRGHGATGRPALSRAGARLAPPGRSRREEREQTRSRRRTAANERPLVGAGHVGACRSGPAVGGRRLAGGRCLQRGPLQGAEQRGRGDRP
jgi:hypothetical protein